MSPLLPPLKSKPRLLLLPVIGVWIVIGHLEQTITYQIAAFYHILFSYVNFPDLIYQSAGTTAYELTKNGSRLSAATYSLLYCSFSMLIIYLYLPYRAVIKITLGLLLGISLLTLLLNETGKLLSFDPFRIIAYRLMSLVVSPLVVIILIPAMALIIPKQESRS